MAQLNHTPRLSETEEALTVLFCLIDDAYAHLNPRAQRYESLKRLSDSEVIALALFQQLRGVESERSFLRDAQRFFSHLFPGVVGLHPSSLHRRVRKLRRFLEPLRRDVLSEIVGNPETLLVDSTLLSVLHPRQVPQGSGFSGAAWVRWGSFSVYGVKLHLICATNGVPLSYELTPANVADVSLTEELINEAALGDGVARRLLGGSGLPKRGVEGGPGRDRHPFADGAIRAAAWAQAASGDRHLQPEEGVRPERDFGYHPRGAGRQDRGQDSSLHLRLRGQQDAGTPSRPYQGVVGVNLTTHI